LASKIVITDLDAVDHEVKPRSCKLSLKHEGADYFSFRLKDPDGSIRQWLKLGCKVKIYVDTASPPTTLRLYGMVEKVEVKQPIQKSTFLMVEGREYFYIKTLRRIVTETYLNKEVSEIVKDLIAKYAPEIDTTNVNVTTTTLEDIRFPYRGLKDCLEDLARLSGFTYYCTPDLKLYWFEKGAKDSGVSYDEADIKVAPEKLESLIPVRNRVFVIGGNYLQVDQKQETTAAYVGLDAYWYAQSFTPAKKDLAQINLNLAKVGSPTEDLQGQIYKDDNGVPGETIASFIIDKDFVSASPSWRPVTIDTDVLVNRKYWIVLAKTGDASNTYLWYHDNDTAGEHAYSADGEAWTLVSNSFQFAFKTRYKVPILASAADYSSKDRYEWRETVIRDESIVSRETARALAKVKLEELRKERLELREITVLDPTSIPQPGELVTLNLPRLGVENTKSVVREFDLTFRGGLKGAYEAKLKLGEEAEQLAHWLRSLKLEIEKTKIRAFGVEYGLLNLYRDFSDVLALADALSATEQLSGTFVTDTAKVGFSDVA
jgi:hypothetical protein